jgi:hypothetical protein
MMNLVAMVVMCAIVIGVLIISFIVFLEGSMKLDPISFLYVFPLVLIVWLNIHVISLDDYEEVRFF